MLYPKNQESCLKDELFASPSCEYRGAPFWAWNQKLIPEKLLRQIEMLKSMGMGGFHMHVRTGMDSRIWDGEFMDRIRLCTEKAKQDGMLAWLYDEDRWPSGSAGGKVTAGRQSICPAVAAFTVHPYTPDRPTAIFSRNPAAGNPVYGRITASCLRFMTSVSMGMERSKAPGVSQKAHLLKASSGTPIKNTPQTIRGLMAIPM